MVWIGLQIAILYVDLQLSLSVERLAGIGQQESIPKDMESLLLKDGQLERTAFLMNFMLDRFQKENVFSTIATILSA
jgi:hypothetical protein